MIFFIKSDTKIQDEKNNYLNESITIQLILI
jgi:hypothetical protein